MFIRQVTKFCCARTTQRFSLKPASRNSKILQQTYRLINNSPPKQSVEANVTMEKAAVKVPIKKKSYELETLIRLNNIEKSQQDTRDYRGLHLENGLKVLLISDPHTDVSAAALAVQVGHMSDPDNLPGLAHFCEHMLFLGTEKYPHENGYTVYLSQSGGSSNAATYPLMTKYYFHVAPDKLGGALDRFAQFFIKPLFTPSATEREINAVNSEHEKNVSNDTWRIRQVQRHLARDNHAYKKFGSGNKITLSDIPKAQNIDVREELLRFHKKWYSANIMSLAVIGKETLDELEDMVLDTFLEIENKNVEFPKWPRDPFNEDQYGQKLMILPVKDIRSLTLSFTTDDLTELYKSSPENYLTHLIGHEGKGSLLSELRRLGWCNGLVAGHQNTLRGFGFFEIIIDLTQEGIEHVDDIVHIVFQYLQLLREEEPQKWIFDECVNLNEMRFRFKDKEQPENLVTSAVSSMQVYPLEEVLTAPYLSKNWNPELIVKLLSELIPSKCRVILVSQSYENKTPSIEPYYKAKYGTEKIPSEILRKWENCGLNKNLTLPEPNDFIPTNFELAPLGADITKYPAIIMDNPIIRVWHKQDDCYLKPKACMVFDFSNPIAYLDPLNCNLNQMLVSLLKDQLNEYLYDAELAGLKLNVINKSAGISLTIKGYNDKQAVLLEKVLDHLFDFKIDKKRFEILKEDYTRSLKNFKAEQPFQHAIYYLALIMTENAWSNSELLDAMQLAFQLFSTIMGDVWLNRVMSNRLEETGKSKRTSLVTYERLENFVKEFFERLHTECFIYGNVTKERALDITSIVNNRLEATNSVILPLLARQMLKKREYKLCNRDSYLFERENEYHKSSCAEMYLQCGPQTDRTNIIVSLIAQIITEPCYDCLRTKEQLGYIVFCGLRKVNGATGIRIIVQSMKHPSFVEDRIENFLKTHVQYIETMPLDEFERHKEALAIKKLEKRKTIYQEFSHFYNEIALAQYHFEREEAEVSILKTITKEEFIESFKTFIACDGPERRVLSVHILSTKFNENAVEDKEIRNMEHHIKISDLSAFKSSKELYPIASPFLDIRAKGARSKL